MYIHMLYTTLTITYILNILCVYVQGGAMSICATVEGFRFIASGGGDGTVRVWRLDSRELVSQLATHSKPVSRVLIDVKEPSHVHSLGVDGSLFTFDIKTGRKLASHLGDCPALGLTQRKDAELELITSDTRGKLLVWDKDSREPVLCIEDPSRSSLRVCIVSPSGRYLATAGDDHKVEVINLTSFEMIAVGEAHSGSISCLAWSADEAHLVVGGDDCCLSVWHFGRR